MSRIRWVSLKSLGSLILFLVTTSPNIAWAEIVWASSVVQEGTKVVLGSSTMANDYRDWNSVASISVKAWYSGPGYYKASNKITVVLNTANNIASTGSAAKAATLKTVDLKRGTHNVSAIHTFEKRNILRANRTITRRTSASLRILVGPTKSVVDVPMIHDVYDAEQDISGAYYTRNSSDLELTIDVDHAGGNGDQRVGLRWADVPIPKGATITKAYIKFTAKGSSSASTTNVQIRGHDVDSAAAFASKKGNSDINSRWNNLTSAKVSWNNIPSWSANQRKNSPDLRGIIQEIVNRQGWKNGNRLVIFLYGGTGLRRAWSRNGGGESNAPTLHVEYTT